MNIIYTYDASMYLNMVFGDNVNNIFAISQVTTKNIFPLKYQNNNS